MALLFFLAIGIYRRWIWLRTLYCRSYSKLCEKSCTFIRLFPVRLTGNVRLSLESRSSQ